MKKYPANLLAFLCMAALPAYADCPDLTGKWLCKSADNGEYKQELVIKDNTMTVTDDTGTSTYILDGLDHMSDDNATYNGQCRGSSIVLREWGEELDLLEDGKASFLLSSVMHASANLDSYKESVSLVVTDEQGNDVLNENVEDECRKVK